MIKLLSKNLVSLLLLTPLMAFALQDDQLRGEVVDVNEDARTLTLKILEVGEGLDFNKGAIRTFPVPEEAHVEGYLSTDLFTSLGDLDEKDKVRVEFDPAEPSVFISIWYEVKQDS